MSRYYIDRDENGDLYKRLISGYNLEGSCVGTVAPFAGTADKIPSDWELCDGRLVSRTAYPELFAVIGTTYGEGDGSTTFALPDYREVALVGVGTNDTDTIAAHDVYTLGEFKDDQTQHISGSVSADLLTTVQNYSSGPFRITGTGGRGGSSDAWYWSASNFDNARVARTGTTDHGKQKGIYYIIKAKATNMPSNLLNTIQQSVANYSTTPRVVGKWIDGSDIYQKTITNTTYAAGDTGLGSVPATVIKLEGSFLTGTAWTPMSGADMTSSLYNVRPTINSSTGELTLTTRSYTPTSWYVTIQWTKGE